jgi:multidrug efflux pump subunit AcrA (membrane-fusion protein)
MSVARPWLDEDARGASTSRPSSGDGGAAEEALKATVKQPSFVGWRMPSVIAHRSLLSRARRARLWRWVALIRALLASFFLSQAKQALDAEARLAQYEKEVAALRKDRKLLKQHCRDVAEQKAAVEAELAAAQAAAAAAVAAHEAQADAQQAAVQEAAAARQVDQAGAAAELAVLRGDLEAASQSGAAASAAAEAKSAELEAALDRCGIRKTCIFIFWQSFLDCGTPILDSTVNALPVSSSCVCGVVAPSCAG